MNLKTVTLTGADDSVRDIQRLADLSAKFPFVEWGILVSSSQQGGSRFPSLDWVADLHGLLNVNEMSICVHVCGSWVRSICAGNWVPLMSNFGPLVGKAKRIQLNFHAYEHLINDRFMDEARRRATDNNKQLIFQVDGVNDHLVSKAYDNGIDAVPLYDKSGGAGIVPDSWPKQMAGIESGYAGGLGPDNVLEQSELISEVLDGAETPIWIDMETKLYTDGVFDLDKCEQVLEKMEPVINA